MPKLNTPITWYGALLHGDGRVQCITARTLPRPQMEVRRRDSPDVVVEGQPETTYEIMTDPVRASWPSL